MANINLMLAAAPEDGQPLAFRAPCDCSSVMALVTHYPDTNGDMASQTFTFMDAQGNVLVGTDNLFSEGNYVTVVLNTTDNYAYLLNANTNAYLESRFDTMVATTGGTMSGALTVKKLILTSGTDYGTSLPSSGTTGQLFFLKV